VSLTVFEVVEVIFTVSEIVEATPIACEVVVVVFRAGFARLSMFSSLNITFLEVRISSLTGFYSLKIVVVLYPSSLIFLDLEANLLLA
jgi:hypothetical protein